MKLIFSILTLALAFTQAFAQQAYNTGNNQSSNWENPSIWNKSQNWMENTPGNQVSGSHQVTVNGFVTRNGDLPVNGSATLSVLDTLIVTGDVNAAGSATIDIGDEGLFIVMGDMELGGALNFQNQTSGRVIVKGEFKASGSASLQTNDQFYIFDDNPEISGGANINGDGPNYSGGDMNQNILDDFSTEEALAANYPKIYDYVANGNKNALPVTLAKFYLEANRNDVDLYWITLMEINFSHFDIERSVYDQPFEKIASVKGNGNTNKTQHYHFTDFQTPAGRIHYRLKIVDIDGSFEYSEIIKLDHTPEQNIAVYPNPAAPDQTIELWLKGFDTESKTMVSVYTLQGNLLFQTMCTQQKLPLNQSVNFTAGIFLIKAEQNGRSKVMRLIVN